MIFWQYLVAFLAISVGVLNFYILCKGLSVVGNVYNLFGAVVFTAFGVRWIVAANHLFEASQASRLFGLITLALCIVWWIVGTIFYLYQVGRRGATLTHGK